METLETVLKHNYDWALHRMNVLSKLATIEDIEDADSIRKEFKEWIHSTNDDHDILSLQYFGQESEFDI
tara:strand:- start:126 stop:332 length:207 start_codon:yes stop_codon:yes gene_type:complete